MKYELLQKNNYYHIFNQGNNGEDIFIEEKNYSYFLQPLQKYVVPIGSILSYCLLKNHFHLLVQIQNIEDEKLISKAFSNLFNAYAKAINKQYNRTGSLFRDRFRRIRVDNSCYLQQLVMYINLNPVYHQFVENIEDYKHSSFLSLISEKPTSLERKTVLDLFEGKENLIYTLKHKKIIFDEKMNELILE